jgi:hypothetical protein
MRMKIEIEVEDDAIAEAKQIFKTNRDFIDMLNRMGSAYKRHDRRYIGHIACTGGDWKRYKDWLTRTRTAFVEERHGSTIVLVVKHVLPRTDMTYEVFKWLWEVAA